MIDVGFETGAIAILGVAVILALVKGLTGAKSQVGGTGYWFIDCDGDSGD